MSWEVILRFFPPYSYDLAPRDFHLFGPLEEVLRGNKFQDNEDFNKFVGNRLKRQDKELFYFLVRHSRTNRVSILR